MLPPRWLCKSKSVSAREANILDSEGNIDMPEAISFEYLDIVLAGFHEGTGYAGKTLEENTEAMVAVILSIITPS